MNSLGEYLRAERLRAGLSLATLSETLDVTKGYLSRLESGKAKPSKAMIDQLAEMFNIDPNLLYIMAGYLTQELEQILHQHPIDAANVLRETFGEYQQDKQENDGIFTHTTVSSAPVRQAPYLLVNTDCFDWLQERFPDSIHAVVTDPPYGLKEYTAKEKHKLRQGKGGIWRIPPTLDGVTRSPLPRFTVLNNKERAELRVFFNRWGKAVYRILVPGGHLFIATNPLVSHLVYIALEEAGFEKRGEIIRLVQTLRGGDRPKNAHQEFQDVTVIPRSCWEPWGLFRKPCEGRVQDNLRKWKTGGLRRISAIQPFADVIKSAPTRKAEREVAPHPSLKPQAFMRQIVRASLPLGQGIVLDPFMGAGSTIAAAVAVGYESIGIEFDPEFFNIAEQAIPKLAELVVTVNSGENSLPLDINEASQQSSLF